MSGGNIAGAAGSATSRAAAGSACRRYYDRTNRDAMHFGESRNTFDVDFLHHTPIGRRHSVSWGARRAHQPVRFHDGVSDADLRPRRSRRIASCRCSRRTRSPSSRDALWLTLGSKFEHNNDSGLEVQPSARLLWRPNVRSDGVDGGDAGRADAVPHRHRSAADRFRTGRSAGLSASSTASKDFRSETPGRRRGGVSAAARVAALSRRDGVPQRLRRSGRLRRLRVDRASANRFRICSSRCPTTTRSAGRPTASRLSPDWRPASWLQLKGAYAFLTVDMTESRRVRRRIEHRALRGVEPAASGLRAGLADAARHGCEFDHTYRFAGRLASQRRARYITGRCPPAAGSCPGR